MCVDNLCGYLYLLSGLPVPWTVRGVRQIDTSQQQRQLFVPERHLRLRVGGPRPSEPSLLQALGAYPQAAAVPEQQFQTIALRVGKQEDVPAQRIALQPVAHPTVEALEAFAHVRGPRCQIDPRGRSPTEHTQARSSTASNCANVRASNRRDFDSTAAFQGLRQAAGPTALRRRAIAGYFDLHPADSARGIGLRLPFPIASQRGQAQAPLPAEVSAA